MDVPLLDKVPGYNIYIGGFISLRRPKALANCNITHIISVIDWKFADESPLIRGREHLHIPVDDIDDENIIEWFPKSNAFIEQGLDYWQADAHNPGANHIDTRDVKGGSGVLVHCAMGKSRSATIILAYLLWKSYRNHHSHQYTPPSTSAPTPPIDPRPNQSRDTTAEPLTPDTALGLLRQGRPLAEPNDGFMEQLHLYHSMGCPDVIDTHPKYQRWLYQKHVQESLTVNQAPELDNIRFEDEHEDDSAGIVGKAKQQTRELDIKCRKCRRLLAKSNFLIDHQPPPPPADPQAVQHQKQSQVRKEEQNCAHLFVHPLSWMRDTLREGQLDGRLVCPNPKCGANVGKFAWQGMKCSCGGWVTPGFGLARGRVDEVVALRDRKGVGGRIERDGETGPSMGVRMPPGMRKEGGHL